MTKIENINCPIHGIFIVTSKSVLPEDCDGPCEKSYDRWDKRLKEIESPVFNWLIKQDLLHITGNSALILKGAINEYERTSRCSSINFSTIEFVPVLVDLARRAMKSDK